MTDVAGVPVRMRKSPRASPIPSARRSKALRRSPARCRSIWSPRAFCWCSARRCRNERRAGLDVADGGRESDRGEEILLARGDAILSRPDRAMAAARSMPSWRSRRTRRWPRPTPPTRRSPRARPPGALHGVPLAHKDMYYDAGKVVTCGSKIRRDFVATDDLDRVAAPEGRRHGPARLAADGGIRLRADRPQPALRRGAQSLECRSHHRRLVVRLGLGGRGAADLCGAGLRYRRLDPDARAFLRRHRLQDHGRP